MRVGCLLHRWRTLAVVLNTIQSMKSKNPFDSGSSSRNDPSIISNHSKSSSRGLRCASPPLSRGHYRTASLSKPLLILTCFCKLSTRFFSQVATLVPFSPPTSFRAINFWRASNWDFGNFVFSHTPTRICWLLLATQFTLNAAWLNILEMWLFWNKCVFLRRKLSQYYTTPDILRVPCVVH